MSMTIQKLKVMRNQETALVEKTENAMQKMLDGINKLEPHDKEFKLWERFGEYKKAIKASGEEFKPENLLVWLKTPNDSGLSDEVLLKKFTQEAYETEYNGFLKKYFHDARKVKRSMKKELKVIDKDMHVCDNLWMYFKKEYSNVKYDVRDLKKLIKANNPGLSKAAKFGIAGAVALGVTGLCCFGYNYFFGKNNKTDNGSKPSPDDNVIKPAVDSTAKADTTVMVSADTVKEEVPPAVEVKDTVKEEPSPVVVISADTLKEEVVPAVVVNTDTSKTAAVPEVEINEAPAGKTAFVSFDYYMFAKPAVDTLPGPFDPNRPKVEPKPKAVEESVKAEADAAVSKEDKIEVDEAAKKEADRIAFENAVTKIRNMLSAEGVTSETYTIVKGDCLWKIAKKNLIDCDGIENPSNSQIVERIALIAVLNEDIKEVTTYKLFAGNTVQVPGKELTAYIASNKEIQDMLKTISVRYA